MFERLNQPISFRRKPTAEDALETAAPAAQAHVPADAESQGRKRTSLFARLNQPISPRGKSKRQDADATPAAVEKSVVRQTRSASPERSVVTPAPAAKSESVIGSAERVIATPAPAAAPTPTLPVPGRKGP